MRPKDLAQAIHRIEQNDHWLDGAPSSEALRTVLAAARDHLCELEHLDRNLHALGFGETP